MIRCCMYWAENRKRLIEEFDTCRVPSVNEYVTVFGGKEHAQTHVKVVAVRLGVANSVHRVTTAELLVIEADFDSFYSDGFRAWSALTSE